MNAEFLKTHWPVITALVVCGTAWGQTQQKVATLEATVVKINQQDEKIVAVKEQAIRNEEQLKAVRAQLDTQNQLLRALVEANPAAKRNLERK